MQRPVAGVGRMRASLKEGPSDRRAGSKGGKVQDEVREAAGPRPCRASQITLEVPRAMELWNGLRLWKEQVRLVLINYHTRAQ